MGAHIERRPRVPGGVCVPYARDGEFGIWKKSGWVKTDIIPRLAEKQRTRKAPTSTQPRQGDVRVMRTGHHCPNPEGEKRAARQCLLRWISGPGYDLPPSEHTRSAMGGFSKEWGRRCVR